MALRLLPLLPLVALSLACSTDSQTATSAFSRPIDFAFACEGDGHTVAPQNDETAAALTDTRMCPDLPSGEEGDLFGVVLDRWPAQLLVVQLNPASSTRRLIDVDYFVPGTNGIAVGRDPLRVLTAPDWSAFYVVSAGDRRVDRIALRALGDDDALTFDKTSFDLPGAPIGAEVLGDELVVLSRDTAELWAYDLAADPVAPPLRAIATADRVEHVTALDDHWLVTWRTRPTLAMLDTDGAILSEHGLVAACRDGLDNDGDSLADKDDPDCSGLSDDDEGPDTGAERADVPPSKASFDGAPSCDNGVDDDGDGATDYPADLACAALDDDGELRPACDDGIDQDGDGLTDLADETCYARWNNVETQAPDDGPFHPTFIDGGVYGRFVYVLDERLGEVAVFDFVEGALTRVDVNAADATPPTLEYVGFGDFTGEVQERRVIPAVRPPAYRFQRIRNILMTETNASSLSSGRIRGELWERIIDAPEGETPSVSLTPNSATWKPKYCAPTPTDRCAQPPLDDASWFAFGANLDGRIQLFEVIRRGTPVHRLAQRLANPAQREHDVSTPRLTRRGALVNARGEPQVGLPFIGAALEEMLAERVENESPERLRRYGVWPPDDFDETPNETWTITFQGAIPGASGRLGHLLDETTFVDADAAFCEAGVAPGDLLQLEVPVESVDPSLVHTLDVVAGGQVCPTVPAKTALIEVAIAEVGMTSLGLDPSTARARPQLPTLDEAAIDAARLSLRACREARSDLDETLGLPDRLAPLDPLTPAALPSESTYRVRAGQWAIVGTRSGFMHRQRWDRAAGACVSDDALDPRLTGRASEVPDAVSKYATCPPPPDQLAHDTVTAIAPEAGRFINPSFGVDIFPACDVVDGAIVPVPSQQDTAFTFSVTGPHEGGAMSITDAYLIPRVPLLDFRRQQVQLDTSAKRAAILQYRVGNPEVIVIFQ